MKLPDFLWWLPIGSVPEIEPDHLKAWLAKNRNVQIVDARTAPEFESGTIGKAQHAPITGMPGSLAQLDLDPEKPVVMLCLSGHRSRPGTRWLRARGYEAYSLKGGITAWRGAGYSTRRPSQTPKK